MSSCVREDVHTTAENSTTLLTCLKYKSTRAAVLAPNCLRRLISQSLLIMYNVSSSTVLLYLVILVYITWPACALGDSQVPPPPPQLSCTAGVHLALVGETGEGGGRQETQWSYTVSMPSVTWRYVGTAASSPQSRNCHSAAARRRTRCSWTEENVGVFGGVSVSVCVRGVCVLCAMCPQRFRVQVEPFKGISKLIFFLLTIFFCRLYATIIAYE